MGDPPGVAALPPEGRRNNIEITNTEGVRNIIIKAKNETDNLCKLGPFAISKFIEHIVQTQGAVAHQSGGGRRGHGGGTPRHYQNNKNQSPAPISYIPQYRSNSLLIKTTNSLQTQQLLKAKKLGNYDIITTIPIGPNTCRGVVNIWGFRDLSEETIMDELKSQNVIGVRHFRRKGPGGDYNNTNTVTLTFQSTVTPREIKAGYLIAEVKPFIQRPRKCFKCQKFGHITKWCRSETTVCGKCTENHDTNTCQATEDVYVCAVCPDKAKHASTDQNCPTYLYQKQICEIMSIQNVSFIEAKKQVIPMSGTYAAAAKKKKLYMHLHMPKHTYTTSQTHSYNHTTS